MTQEEARLAADRDRTAYWKRWGPYLSERQWGTVREDYSATGEAWDYFPHDQARSMVAAKAKTVRLRLSDSSNLTEPFGTDFDTIWQNRVMEADEFYERISPPMSEDMRNVQRQAFAGILWSKLFYYQETSEKPLLKRLVITHIFN